MPRAGLARSAVVGAAADLADEVGYHNLTMGLLAERLGVRTPSLYKHVTSLADVQHRIATLAVTQLDDVTRDAIAGWAGRQALAALATAFRDYIRHHPGRYVATIGAPMSGHDDPLYQAGARLLHTMTAALRGYCLPSDQTVHALRTLRATFHGFATLQAFNGFQRPDDPDETFHWLIELIDRGLRG
ncbi:TetR/AcrR family transcriptional regulator [Rugosimonospora acidiphila]|uniref:TetR/AcrR family transcriptional regulator n=1 Tax=Rugosimonospora acidiphila TaxID=556531 RepID=A0ABP9SMI2_9ACTN